MSSLFSVLSQSSTALNAHQTASATASHNLQNVNTPGYARQRAEMEAVRPGEHITGGFVGQGTRVQTVTQTRDRFLESRMPAALSAQSKAGAQADALEALSELDPDAASGLGSSLSAFFSSLRQLAQNPSDPGLRTATLSQARSLAMAFQSTAGGIASARSGLDAQVEARTQEVNQAASGMADLNQRIAVARASGGEPNDLLDARLQLRDRLAELTGAVAVADGEGNLNMAIPGGTALVQGNRASQLGTQPDPADHGHLAVTLRLPDGSPARALGAGALGGSLGGSLEARDGALAQSEQDVDQLAYDLADKLNTAHAAGVALDGSSGRNLLDVGGAVDGAARAMKLDAAMDGHPELLGTAAVGGGPGDAGGVWSLVDVQTTRLSNGLDVTGGWARTVGSYGSTAQAARSEQERAQVSLDQLSALRESASGVSIDEEMINLTKSQRAYEAVLQVVKTADSMLDGLMKLR